MISLGMIAFAGVVIFLVKLFIWLWGIDPALMIIPMAVIGFGGLYGYDYLKALKKKGEDEKALKEEQEAMAKIIHDENDDWRDPHW